MPQYDKKTLNKVARETGFSRDTFEKVLRLKEILTFFNQHNLLSQKLMLKGGTAINLAIFNLPRLSVDIDLDFSENLSKEETQENRKQITDIISRYMTSEGYSLSPDSRLSHSLDSFHFKYQNAAGNQDMIKIEINYSLRSHLFPMEQREILPDIFGEKISVSILSPIEIFAAKTNALIDRHAPRDLYDFNNMVDMGLFGEEQDLFRKSIIFYHTMTAKNISLDFDLSGLKKLTFSKIRSELFPVLNTHEHFDLEVRLSNASDYIRNLMSTMTNDERKYLESFISGKYQPELLFDDPQIIGRIIRHPMALWRCP